MLPHSILQRLHLDHLNKRLAMSVDLRPWSISRTYSHTFHLALPTPVTFLGPRLGCRILGSRAPLGEVDTNCNSSYFLKGVMKMANIDIGLFGKHNKTNAQPDTGEIIPFTPAGVHD